MRSQRSWVSFISISPITSIKRGFFHALSYEIQSSERSLLPVIEIGSSITSSLITSLHISIRHFSPVVVPIARLFWVKQVQKYAKNPNNTYFLQMDIKNFFPSINKHILWELLQTHIQKIEKIWKNRKEFYLTTLKKIVFQDLLKPYVIYTGDKTLLEKIPKEKSLFHRPKHLWLPIGSLTSQFFANIYLNELDRFIKHTLRAKNYVRYVDDFVILSSDKNELLNYQTRINEFLQSQLHLEIHPKKTKLLPTQNGIDFLWYIIKKDSMLIRERTIKMFKRKLYFLTISSIQ